MIWWWCENWGLYSCDGCLWLQRPEHHSTNCSHFKKLTTPKVVATRNFSEVGGKITFLMSCRTFQWQKFSRRNLITNAKMTLFQKKKWSYFHGTFKLSSWNNIQKFYFLPGTFPHLVITKNQNPWKEDSYFLRSKEHLGLSGGIIMGYSQAHHEEEAHPARSSHFTRNLSFHALQVLLISKWMLIERFLSAQSLDRKFCNSCNREHFKIDSLQMHCGPPCGHIASFSHHRTGLSER